VRVRVNTGTSRYEVVEKRTGAEHVVALRTGREHDTI